MSSKRLKGLKRAPSLNTKRISPVQTPIGAMYVPTCYVCSSYIGSSWSKKIAKSVDIAKKHRYKISYGKCRPLAARANGPIDR